MRSSHMQLMSNIRRSTFVRHVFAIVAISIAAIAAWWLNDVVHGSSKAFRRASSLANSADGEHLWNEAKSMSAADVDSAASALAMSPCGCGRDSANFLSRLDADSNKWNAVVAALLLGTRGKMDTKTAVRENLLCCLQVLNEKGHPIEMTSQTFGRWQANLVEIQMWALIQIEGIDGHQWLKDTFQAMGSSRYDCADEVLRVTAILSWADSTIDNEKWALGRVPGFDDEWPQRFIASLRKRGIECDTTDREELVGSLIGVLEDDELRANSGVLENFWTRASASMLLCAITGEARGRRVFPFAIAYSPFAGLDPEPWEVWLDKRG